MNVSVNLTPKLRLKQALKEAGVENPASITQLTVAGTLNHYDLQYIRRNMSETLQELDLSHAKVSENKIEDSAFQFCMELTSLIIPDTTTEIGENIFYFGNRLTSFFIPRSVVEIGRCFCHCEMLHTITVHPDNPEYSSVDGVLFNKDKTILLNYPPGRKGDYAVPASVTRIAWCAFNNCTIPSIEFPASVEIIPFEMFCDHDFTHCCSDSTLNCVFSHISVHPDNPDYASVDGVLFSKDKTELHIYPWKRQGSDYAVPASVTKIGWGAFNMCEGLTRLTIPASVLETCKETFDGCPAFISVHPDNPAYSSEDGILFNKDKTELLHFPGSWQGDYVIPASVKKFRSVVFSSCKGLTSVYIPTSVKKIDYDELNLRTVRYSVLVENEHGSFYRKFYTVHPDNPFNESFIKGESRNVELTTKTRLEKALKRVCIDDPASVTKLTISGTVTGKDFEYIRDNMAKTLQKLDLSHAKVRKNKIENHAFNQCPALTWVTIPETTTAIGDSIFSFGNRMTEFFIPASVVEIGGSFCTDCKMLHTITVHPDNPAFSSADGVLFNKDKIELLVYPSGRNGDYTIPASVVKIGCGAFMYCDVASLVVPASVTEIDEKVFFDSRISSIEFPASVTWDIIERFCNNSLSRISVHPDHLDYASVDGVLFNKDKTELLIYPRERQDSDYTVPAPVVKIREDAFSHSTNLKSVIIPVSVKEIGDGVFFDSKALTSVVIDCVGDVPGGITEIRSHTFALCDCLTSVTVPASVKKIEWRAFRCKVLTAITIPASVVEIDEEAFFLCPAAITVHPGNPAYSSEDGILFNKDKTELLHFPGSWQGDYVIPASVVKIGDRAFYDCEGLTSVYIPTSITTIGKSAFGCTGLESVNIPQSVIKIESGNFFRTFVTVHPGNPVYTSEEGKIRYKRQVKPVVKLTTKTRLEWALWNAGIEDTALVVKLTVSGTLTKDDFEYIRKNMSQYLQELDLSHAKVRKNKIEGFAFDGCTALTSVMIPETTTVIGECLFNGRNHLKSFFIPASVVKIGCCLTDGCNDLHSITVHPDNPAFSDIDGVLFNKDKTEFLIYPPARKGDYIIPASVVKIDAWAIAGCYITSLVIPDSVTEITSAAFSHSVIESIEFPASVTSIGLLLFMDNDVTHIAVHPDNPVYSSADGVLFNKDKTELLVCPNMKKGDYVIPASVVKIPRYAFGDCKSLTSVTIPASVKEIAEDAFKDCPAFITVHPDNPVYMSENGKIKEK
jgi:5-bromo-4-chloroindolyl phosphate hydrolysis protein